MASSFDYFDKGFSEFIISLVFLRRIGSKAIRKILKTRLITMILFILY